MPRLGNINQYEQKKAQRKADALPAAVPPVQEAIRPQSQELREGFQQMPQQPVLQTRDANEMYQATRSQALRHESNLADPQKAQEFWNASPYEYWTEQVKANPNSTYAILNQMYASKETPEEKAKRERREQLGEVFNNLGNLIGNAANLYYTHRGGQYIDLNSVNEKHRARMERLREKQDALKQRQDELLGKAKLSDVQAERAERAAKAKTDADARAKELDYKRDLALKQIEHAFRIGQIDAQTAANMKRDAARATSEMELEAFKQKNRITLKNMDSDSGKNKKSTFTYNGTAYDKKSLSSMVALYNKLRQDGYAMPKVKGNNVNQYIDAIANSMSKGTYNLGDFSKGAETKYPNIIDSDLNQENRNGGLGWGNKNESKDETDW